MSKTQIVSGGIKQMNCERMIATADIADDAVTAAKASGLVKILQVVGTTITSNQSGNTSSEVMISNMLPIIYYLQIQENISATSGPAIVEDSNSCTF